MKKRKPDISLSDVHQSVDTTTSGSRWKKVLSFFGPAYLVSVGYMDPGNWATDLAGGSQFGYSLLWVLVMSNIMALLLQSLSARLGIVRHKDLAQANRETYPKKVNFILYVLAEIAIAATDLAEILGMAIGLQLLTGMPLIWGVLITVLDTFLLMLLQRFGIRKLEAFILGLIFVIGISFLIQIFIAAPSPVEIASGLIPKLENDTALYIAIGIIGATVMPHNLYLHSALVQTRKFNTDKQGIKRALKLNFIDSAVALNMALLVNAGILILAATVFYKTGRTDVAEIKQAYELLPQQLGSVFASKLFAIALIAAGQSSTITGTLAGQIVMEGYLSIRLNPILRRLITRLVAVIPAALVILINGENNIDYLLILSQVILSLQLGFAIVPLIQFVSDKNKMGEFAINLKTKIFAWTITSVLVYLNLRMIIEQASSFFNSSDNIWLKGLVILGMFFLVFLLLYIVIFPYINTSQKSFSGIHKAPTKLYFREKSKYVRIGIALDFSDIDEKLITHAIAHGQSAAKYYLIHSVESISASFNYYQTADEESITDKQLLDNYVEQLSANGFNAIGILGYGSASKELSRIINENGIEILIMGAHGHKAFKDFIYGHTIDKVRHKVKIPILIVSK